MTKSFLILPCLLLLLSNYSCKKAKQEEAAFDTYAGKIAGKWLIAGTGWDERYGKGDVFIITSFTLKDNRRITTGQFDTLVYKSTDTKAHTITYSGSYESYSNVAYENLVYNYATNTINYGYSANGAGPYGFSESGESVAYPGSAAIKKYTDNLLGTKIMAGMLIDTILDRLHPDSMATITDTLKFTAINDSTISCNPDYLHIGDTVLRFRSFNTDSQTIVFQTLHTASFPIFTSLTYNYAIGRLTFEQYVHYNSEKRYLKLQFP